MEFIDNRDILKLSRRPVRSLAKTFEKIYREKESKKADKVIIHEYAPSLNIKNYEKIDNGNFKHGLYGSNETTYICMKKEPIYLGAYDMRSKKEPDFNEVEKFVELATGSLKANEFKANHFDLIRKLTYNRIQKIEVKKVTGHYNINNPPTMIKSSIAQIIDLCHTVSWSTQIWPSLLIMVSVDNEKRTKNARWIATCWLVLCNDVDDFVALSTARGNRGLMPINYNDEKIKMLQEHMQV